MSNNWYVITGGPCAGKTTTIKILKKRGYNTTPEIAREYYKSQMKLGKTNEEIKSDPQTLQDGIARGIIDLENSLDSRDEIFLDRGIPDNYAYYEYFNIKPPKFLKDAYNNCNYKKVFYLERLPLKKDAVRIESEEQMQLLADLALKYYREKKANLIMVPVMSKEDRVDFILQNLT